MTTMTVTTILAFLATYLVHSTVLQGTAWTLTRFVVRGESWRETLWKAALVGGLATAVVAQAAPWTPVRFAWPGTSPEMEILPPVAGSDVRTGRLAREPSGSTAETASDVRSTAPASTGSESLEGTPGRAGSDVLPGASMPAPSPRDAAALAADPSGAGAPVSWPRALLLSWLGVALALLVRLAWRHVRLARILRGRRVVTDEALASTLAELRRSAGVWSPVTLTATEAVSSPLVLGGREICVPERFLTDLGPIEQRAALAHEIGHLARRDRTWQLAAMLLECVFFFQPLHRVARRGLRESAEYLADSWAVRLSGERLGLARCLSQVAAWVAPAGEPSVAHTVAMAEGGSPLLARVSRLLEREPEAEPRVAVRLAAGLALIAVAAAAAPVVGTDARVRGSEGSTGHESAQDATLRPPDGDVVPPLPEDEAGLVDPSTSDDGASTEEQAAPTVLRVPGEGGLEERIARARAQAGDAPRYWIAWAVPSVLPATSHVTMDSEQGFTMHVTDEREPMLRMMGGGGRAATVLGVFDELTYGSDGYDVLVLARVDGGSRDARVTRLAVRSPAMPLRISGEVYWLGRVGADEGLAWQVDAYGAASDRRLAELAVKAAALHDAEGAEAFLRGTAEERSAGRSVRESAVEGLAFHPSDESLGFLRRMARDDADLALRLEAVETLGEMAHPDAPAAVRELLRGGDPRVREEAVETFGESRQDAGVIATLLEVALNDPDADVRQAAVEAIAEQPGERALPALGRLIDESDDQEVLVEVVGALGEIGTPEALAELDSIVSSDLDEEVIGEAVQAMAEGYALDLAAPRLETIGRDHPSTEIRREAIDQLMELRVGGAGGGELLLEIALGQADEESRADAVERMVDLPIDEAVRLLARVALEADAAAVQAEAAEALGDVGTPEALEALGRIVSSDVSEEAVLEAVDAIGEIGTPEGLAVLEGIVDGSATERLKLEAVEAIGDGFPRDLALAALQRIVTEHPSARVRREALDQLADLGGGVL